MDISKYNLVNRSNQVTPNYDLSKKEITIVVYVNLEMDLCIVGEIDPNYVAWCSITKLNDEDINAMIFDYIATSKFDIFTMEYKALGSDIMKERGLSCRITKSTKPNRIWEVPFEPGLGYGTDIKNHGNYFARGVKTFFYEQLNKCKFRISDGQYFNILSSYYKILAQEKEYTYYKEMKPLISILEAESYLLLCPDVSIRDLYKKCRIACSDLYNKYMTAVR